MRAIGIICTAVAGITLAGLSGAQRAAPEPTSVAPSDTVVELDVEGMTCAGCERRVSRGLKPEELVSAVGEAGYEAKAAAPAPLPEAPAPAIVPR